MQARYKKLKHIDSLDLNETHSIMIIGYVEPVGTILIEDIMRRARSEGKGIVALDPTNEYEEIAKDLGLDYVILDVLGLDPVKLYKYNMLSSDDIAHFIAETIEPYLVST